LSGENLVAQLLREIESELKQLTREEEARIRERRR
jgi:hypothetical protein